MRILPEAQDVCALATLRYDDDDDCEEDDGHDHGDEEADHHEGA